MTVTEPVAVTTDTTLVGRVALVTGTSRGIGAAVARALVAAGACVVAVDRDPATVDGVDALAVDLAGADAAGTVVDDVLRRHGRLDIVVNNAGLARHAAVTDIDLHELDLMWAVNVRALVQLTRDAMRAMAPPHGHGGRIVNVVSTAGLAGQPGESAYCATKFAVRGFTEAASEEGRVVGVRVSGLYPAGVHTAFWDGAVGDPTGFTGDKQWLDPSVVADQVVALLRLPLDVDVPTVVVRHPGDTDAAAIAAKLERIRRS
jgi:NAD(P)-dependent dehydrogenase (short-subunit alcohol dehydrogenase family)